jgi:hypothetical protein
VLPYLTTCGCGPVVHAAASCPVLPVLWLPENGIELISTEKEHVLCVFKHTWVQASSPTTVAVSDTPEKNVTWGGVGLPCQSLHRYYPHILS